MSDRNSYLAMLIAAFISSTFIYSINLWFSVSSFYLVVLTILLLLSIIFSKGQLYTAQKIDFGNVLLAILFVFSILSFTLNVEDINGFLSLAMFVNRFAMFLAPIAVLLYFFEKTNGPFLGKLYKYKYPLLIAISLVIQLTLIRIVKVPDIDVYQVLRYGPPRIMALENPYETGATNLLLSSQDFGYSHYAYGPATIFLFLPFDLVLGEPRYLLIIGNFLAAFALYRISKKFWGNSQVAEIISLIYLFNPRMVYFLTFAWTDELIVSLLFLGILLFLNRKFIPSGILLSLAVGVKIFYVLPLLFLLKNKNFWKRKLILSGALIFITLHLPFVLFDWQAIYKSIATINTGPEVFGYLRRSELTFAAFLDRQFNYYPPEIFFVVSVLLILFIFWLLVKKVKQTTTALCAVSLVFILTVFFSPRGNASYYFTASQLILLAIACGGGKKNIYG